MLSIFDDLLQPVYSPFSLILIFLLLVTLIISREKLGRVNPTSKQSVIMLFGCILSLIPLILIMVFQLYYNPNLVILLALFLPFATFYLILLIVVIGFKKREETATLEQ